MSCCTAGLAAGKNDVPDGVARLPNGETLDLLVPDVHCAGCISAVEGAVARLPGVASARLNLSTRRLSVAAADGLRAEDVINAVEDRGYACRIFDAAAAGQVLEDQTGRELLRALAIAGFAAANVMLLSVSIWSGADAATREFFHWLSAIVALPAIAFAGRPFFRSALRILRRRRLNMDVPISLAVLLAAGLSLKVTIEGGDDAFFDAAVMLLFFLLIGRYLDHRVRARARDAVTRLLSLWPSKATRVGPAGLEEVSVDTLNTGDLVVVAAGARVPVDGVVVTGVAELDCAALTGESLPRLISPGAPVHAGALAISGPITIRATAVGEDSFLKQAVRLMEAAEAGRAAYVQLADRAAKIYAPAVHAIALCAFLLQMALTGGDWSYALWVAVSVLIITCPCALGLAVPAVQTAANGALFRAGILVKSSSALERLAEIDRAIFDKTGTLTLGQPTVAESMLDQPTLRLAGALAERSTHPLAKALAQFADAPSTEVVDVVETPGGGLKGVVNGSRVHIGSFAFVCGKEPDTDHASRPEVWCVIDGGQPIRTTFTDLLRPGASAVVARFKAAGFDPLLLSGDRQSTVSGLANALGFDAWRAEQSPLEKIETVQALTASGARPLMIGDGVNDGPALAAAHVSIAPAEASDISRAAADFVIMSKSLSTVGFAYDIACKSKRLILQNFMLAGAYNIAAIPIAVLGYASPLAAAAAMSTSSILVTLNALRLTREKPAQATPIALGTEMQTQKTMA